VRRPIRFMNRHVADTRPSSSEQEWIDTYNRVKAEGKIPGFPPATNQGGTPVYPQGTDTGENGLCSWTRESFRQVTLDNARSELTSPLSVAHCYGDNDIYDAPDGMYAISFDDGVRARMFQPTPHTQDSPSVAFFFALALHSLFPRLGNCSTSSRRRTSRARTS
jgi:hypothetical protein